MFATDNVTSCTCVIRKSIDSLMTRIYTSFNPTVYIIMGTMCIIHRPSATSGCHYCIIMLLLHIQVCLLRRPIIIYFIFLYSTLLIWTWNLYAESETKLYYYYIISTLPAHSNTIHQQTMMEKITTSIWTRENWTCSQWLDHRGYPAHREQGDSGAGEARGAPPVPRDPPGHVDLEDSLVYEVFRVLRFSILLNQCCFIETIYCSIVNDNSLSLFTMFYDV